VVTTGLTVRVPEAATVPTPWSMLMAVPFVELQVSVELAPSTMVAGPAEMAAVGMAFTDTVAVAVLDP